MIEKADEAYAHGDGGGLGVRPEVARQWQSAGLGPTGYGDGYVGDGAGGCFVPVVRREYQAEEAEEEEDA